MDACQELERIAGELLRHLRWAQARGERGLPPPRPVVPPTGAFDAAPPPKAPEAAPEVGTEAPLAPPPAKAPVEPLVTLRQEIGDCQRCKLCRGRRNLVFGEGNPRARLVFVGEGPGAEEDAQGRPFVGVGSSRVDLQACKLEYSIVSPK